MAYLLRLTLTPQGTPPFEGWGFHCPDTGQCGWLGGDLTKAARAALSMTRGRGVVLILPRAGLLGLTAKRFVIRDPLDVAKLDVVDVDRFRARHKAAARRGLRWAKMRAGGLRVACLLRMPAEWPAVP